jgi:hypothetical protein
MKIQLLLLALILVGSIAFKTRMHSKHPGAGGEISGGAEFNATAGGDGDWEGEDWNDEDWEEYDMEDWEADMEEWDTDMEDYEGGDEDCEDMDGDWEDDWDSEWDDWEEYDWETIDQCDADFGLQEMYEETDGDWRRIQVKNLAHSSRVQMKQDEWEEIDWEGYCYCTCDAWGSDCDDCSWDGDWEEESDIDWEVVEQCEADFGLFEEWRLQSKTQAGRLQIASKNQDDWEDWDEDWEDSWNEIDWVGYCECTCEEFDDCDTCADW